MIIVEVDDGDTTDPPGPRPQPKPGHPLQIMLTGVDGSTWNLNDGPAKLLSGISGLGIAKPEHRWKTSPALDGSIWAGSRTPQRDVILPIKVDAADALAFRDLDDALYDAVDPAGECELTVTTPDAQSRTMRLRYTDGADNDLEDDPLLMTRARYAFAFTAADPYWHGSPATRSWMVGEAEPLFPGPPFHISPSNVLGTATVTNPGDVEAWPIWVIRGPFDAFTVGLGDSTVKYAGPVGADEAITVDMNPRMLTIRDQAGSDRWAQTAEVNFAALPPGEDLPLDLALSGADAQTRIELQFTPRFRRAW